jgi:hypothetical protein
VATRAGGGEEHARRLNEVIRKMTRSGFKLR